MTKKEALEKSIEMWTWLRNQAREGRISEKREYLEKIEKEKSFPESDCFLCEYACLSGEKKCGGCPVSFWAESPSSMDYKLAVTSLRRKVFSFLQMVERKRNERFK